MKNSSVCAVEDAATEIGARETVRAFSLLEQTSLPRLGQMFRSLCAQPHSILCARSQRLNRSLRYIAEVSQDATVAMKTLEANCAATVQQKRLVGAAEGSETPMNYEQEISLSERYTGILAEREGFYYRRYLQVLMNTTLPR